MEEKLTKEQVLEQYGDIELRFSSYYNYSFNYIYKKDGLEIVGSFGRCSDDIYRYDVESGDIYCYDVENDSTVLVKDFEEKLHSLVIIKNKEILFNYYNY